MAASVQIQLTLNDNGTVKGLQAVDSQLASIGKSGKTSGDEAAGGLKKVGQTGNVVLTGLEGDHRKAHVAAQLLTRTLGVEMPRALEGVLARSKVLGPVLTAAFSAGVVLALGAALIGLGQELKARSDDLMGFTDAMKAFNEENIKANRQALVDFKTPQTGQAAIQDSARRESSQQKEIDYLKEAQKLRFLDINGIAQSIIAHYQLGKAIEENTKTISTHNEQLKHEAELTVEVSQKTIEMQGRLAGARAVGPFQAIAAEESTALRLLKLEYSQHLIDSSDFGAQEALIHQTAAAKVEKAWRDLQVKLYAIRKDGSKALLEADAAATSKEVDAAGKIQLEGELKASEKKLSLLKAGSDAEYELAIERAQISGNTIAAIGIQEQKRVNDTIGGLRTIGIAESQLAQLRPELEQAANLRIYQEYRSTIERMGSDFSSLWDDITSGNIGKRIENNFKTFLFQMVAQWALATGAMRGVASSFLGTMLFGPNNSSMQMLAGGQTFAMAGGGGGLGAIALSGLTGGGFGGGAGMIPGVFGLPTGTAATFGGGTAAATGAFGSVSGTLGSTTAGFGPALDVARFVSGPAGASPGLMGSLIGGLPLIAGLAGSKLGGTPAALGAGLLGLIGATAAGSSTASSALSTLAKPLSALFGAQVGAVLGGVGGGLVGFGIGQQYGTGAGILSGAGSGALTGFIAGGPIGAVTRVAARGGPALVPRVAAEWRSVRDQPGVADGLGRGRILGERAKHPEPFAEQRAASGLCVEPVGGGAGGALCAAPGRAQQAPSERRRPRVRPGMEEPAAGDEADVEAVGGAVRNRLLQLLRRRGEPVLQRIVRRTAVVFAGRLSAVEREGQVRRGSRSRAVHLSDRVGHRRGVHRRARWQRPGHSEADGYVAICGERARGGRVRIHQHVFRRGRWRDGGDQVLRLRVSVLGAQGTGAGHFEYLSVRRRHGGWIRICGRTGPVRGGGRGRGSAADEGGRSAGMASGEDPERRREERAVVRNHDDLGRVGGDEMRNGLRLPAHGLRAAVLTFMLTASMAACAQSGKQFLLMTSGTLAARPSTCVALAEIYVSVDVPKASLCNASGNGWVDMIGSTGATGATGAGVPTGGAAGSILLKNSSTNFDDVWASLTNGAPTLNSAYIASGQSGASWLDVGGLAMLLGHDSGATQTGALGAGLRLGKTAGICWSNANSDTATPQAGVYSHYNVSSSFPASFDFGDCSPNNQTGTINAAQVNATTGFTGGPLTVKASSTEYLAINNRDIVQSGTSSPLYIESTGGGIVLNVGASGLGVNGPSFIESLIYARQIVTFSATPTFDASSLSLFKITLTGNVTSSTLSGAFSGQMLTFEICQDGSGSRTFVWPANVKGGMTIGSTASKCNTQQFIYDGSSAYALTSGQTNL
jgi:hypothetical protein